MKKKRKKKFEHKYGKAMYFTEEELSRLGQEPIQAIQKTVEEHDTWQKKALSATTHPL